MSMMDDWRKFLSLAIRAAHRSVNNATNAVQSVYDDVQYGPNDLELPTGDAHPAASVLAVLKAAMDATFWRIARAEGNEYAIAQCSDQFGRDIRHAIQAGAASGDDERLVASVDWSDDTVVDILIGSDGLLGPRAAP